MSRVWRLVLLLSAFSATPHLVSSQSLPVAHFSLVHAFAGGSDGAFPAYASLIFDKDGNLYGATTIGGVQTGQCVATGGCGTIFRIDRSGREGVFYAFGGDTNAPRLPYGTLIRDADGSFYGTSYAGGASGPLACNDGCGTVYVVSSAGEEKTIYSFTGGEDGATPSAALTMDTDGRLYSTTHNGGINDAGVVFALDREGEESVVHAFLDGEDGANTLAGLVRDPAGNLYGTTVAGGGFNPKCLGAFGCGVIYEISTEGEEIVLYRFQGLDDGKWPNGGLIRDEAGNLYGTSGGGVGNSGTVFQLDPAGNFTVLHTFTGGTEGANPTTALTRDADGIFYGTTLFGGGTHCPGGEGCGTVFALTKSGQFKVLHSFDGKDGFWPSSALTLAPSGELYGTTNGGGPHNSGVVFKITRDFR